MPPRRTTKSSPPLSSTTVVNMIKTESDAQDDGMVDLPKSPGLGEPSTKGCAPVTHGRRNRKYIAIDFPASSPGFSNASSHATRTARSTREKERMISGRVSKRAATCARTIKDVEPHPGVCKGNQLHVSAINTAPEPASLARATSPTSPQRTGSGTSVFDTAESPSSEDAVDLLSSDSHSHLPSSCSLENWEFSRSNAPSPSYPQEFLDLFLHSDDQLASGPSPSEIKATSRSRTPSPSAAFEDYYHGLPLPTSFEDEDYCIRGLFCGSVYCNKYQSQDAGLVPFDKLDDLAQECVQLPLHSNVPKCGHHVRRLEDNSACYAYASEAVVAPSFTFQEALHYWTVDELCIVDNAFEISYLARGTEE
jgi:hypothetical protein